VISNSAHSHGSCVSARLRDEARDRDKRERQQAVQVVPSPSLFVRSVAPDRDKGDADECERNQDEGHDVESS
jgi:hypothetical protein